MAESTGPRGSERAPDWLIERVRRKGREVVFAQPGSDDLKYLDVNGANANCGGETMRHVLLREDVRTIELLEEFLHGTQFRLGLLTDVNPTLPEIHVKQFMVRHRRLLRLGDDDVRLLVTTLREDAP